jgi:hypothetical protein
MRKILTLAILGVAGLAGTARAEANDGHRVREVRHPVGYRQEPRPGRVWIAPRYETRIVGYECGRPLTQVVVVAPGCWAAGPVCR